MKRSWLIGAALVFSLTAVGCNDDDDTTTTKDGGAGDSGVKTDAGTIDGGLDAGRDSGTDASTGDAGDAGN